MHLVADISNMEWPKWQTLPGADIHDFLLNLAKEVEMTPIAGPYVYGESGAIIGILVIAESHVSIHADIPNGRAFVDVFSCKDFDFSRVIDELKKTFSGTVAWRLVERGLEYI